MYTLPVLSAGGRREVQAKLPEKVDPYVLYEVVRWQLASRRAGTASTKTRAEVAFTGKKVYAQKGTGRARHGDMGAPIFVGGGTTFGPKPKDFSYTLPKKVRKLGLSLALADRAKEGKLFLVDGFKGVSGKTKEFTCWLEEAGLGSAKSILLATGDAQVARSARNLPNVRVLGAEGLNVYDILRQEVLIVDLAAWEALQQRLGGES